jgi:hypothetical protein
MGRPLLLVPVAALIAVLAFVGRTENRAGAASFSDREIFEGVVFGVGPVATLVPEAREQLRPEIYAHDADELAAMAAVRSGLIASIERDQPELIGEFARIARSGDPAAIRSMLERAIDAVNAAASADRADGLDGTLLANLPLPAHLGDKKRPPSSPSPVPSQLFANLPLPAHLGDKKRPPPSPTPQLAAQPAWSLLSSQLFTEQLASSMAVTLERSAPTGG